MTAREIRQTAWNALKPQWKKVIGITLLAGIVLFFVQTGIEIIGEYENSLLGTAIYSICTLLMLPVYYSIYWVSLRLLRTKEIVIQEIFEPYYSFEKFFKSIGVAVVSYIFLLLWTLLLIIPGIIKSFSYSLIPFIIKDKPELSILETITLSRKMMDGYKWKLFCLLLSFIGWFLLIPLTLGIMALWVVPYFLTAFTAFYEEVKKQYELKDSSK